ncbi:MAG: hypothetical protein M3R59_05825 [Verrucomicrobiota bacterium]|nr:hypothetical protein [Verrucomicrobiota bacterium]
MKTRLILLLAAVASLIPALPVKAIGIDIDVHDRPYYVHGPFYYTGGVRYVWVRGHWNWRHTHWIRGHYVGR